jgi:hypothetical protein
MAKLVNDYTDNCDNCLCSVPRVWMGKNLEQMTYPFYCNHPTHGPDNAKKVPGKNAFGDDRPDWCPLDNGDMVLIQLRPKE